MLSHHDLSCVLGLQANWLRSVGVKKGDAVAIYLPMLCELPIAMLACARIGAVHSVVFGGFSSGTLFVTASHSQQHVKLTLSGACWLMQAIQG